MMIVQMNDAYALGSNIDHPYDYMSHTISGFIISDYMKRKGYTVTETLITVLAIGVAKEMMDKNFDTMDALMWAPGVTINFSIPFD